MKIYCLKERRFTPNVPGSETSQPQKSVENAQSKMRQLRRFQDKVLTQQQARKGVRGHSQDGCSGWFKNIGKSLSEWQLRPEASPVSRRAFIGVNLLQRHHQIFLAKSEKNTKKYRPWLKKRSARSTLSCQPLLKTVQSLRVSIKRLSKQHLYFSKDKTEFFKPH